MSIILRQLSHLPVKSNRFYFVMTRSTPVFAAKNHTSIGHVLCEHCLIENESFTFKNAFKYSVTLLKTIDVL